jgi:hypothetical protein
MNNECIPTKEAAYTQKITVHAGYAITGKTFVGPLTSRQSGGLGGLAADPLPVGDGSNILCPAAPTAGGAVGGVANWDAASGAKVPITRGAGTFLPVTSGAAITVGAELQVDVNGRVVPFAAGKKVGIAHSAAGAAGTDVEVELYPFNN